MRAAKSGREIFRFFRRDKEIISAIKLEGILGIEPVQQVGGLKRSERLLNGLVCVATVLGFLPRLGRKWAGPHDIGNVSPTDDGQEDLDPVVRASEHRRE